MIRSALATRSRSSTRSSSSAVTKIGSANLSHLVSQKIHPLGKFLLLRSKPVELLPHLRYLADSVRNLGSKLPQSTIPVQNIHLLAHTE